METRKIIIHSSKELEPKIINSDATNWGELKSELEETYNFSEMKAIVRETRTTLESNEAILPAGDFMLFLYPKMVKSAANDLYTDMKGAELKKECKERKISCNGANTVLRNRIRNYDLKYSEGATEQVNKDILTQFQAMNEEVKNSLTELKIEIQALQISNDEIKEEIKNISVEKKPNIIDNINLDEEYDRISQEIS